MTSVNQQDVDEALRTIDNHVSSIGDQIIQPISGQTDSGKQVQGRVVQHGQQKYQILAVVGESAVQIRYVFDAAEAIAVQRAITDGGRSTTTPNQQVNIAPEQIAHAKDELQDAAEDEDHLKKIRQGVIDRISEPSIAANLKTDEFFVYGFEVSASLYPFHDDVDIATFSEKVQTVVSLGWKAQSYLVTEYDLRSLLNGGPSSHDGPRGFQ
ncbi:hypothetical protein ACH9L7_06370 [Haloferax sp. S1W]|uniref:hypothetical protein n=1 Tax=Haloferax sp. S1W TaxID=3377110 RepID=UPI0037C72B63